MASCPTSSTSRWPRRARRGVRRRCSASPATTRTGSSSPTTCASPGRGWPPAFADGVNVGRRRASSTSAWAPPTSSTTPPARWTCPARCSPPATTRRSTTASSCAAPAPARSGRTAAWSTSGERAQAAARRPRARPPSEPTAPVETTRPARRLRRAPALARRPAGIRPLKVVVDAGNGMGGYTVPAVLGDQVLPALPLQIVPLYFELDGSFPNHEANPLDPANLVDLQEAVRAARRRHRPGVRRRRRPLLRHRRERRPGLARPRSPRWSRPASWPSSRAAR